PIRGYPAADQVLAAAHVHIFLHLVFNTDLLANADLVRRNIDLLTVDEDVAVTDKLPGLSMGCGETETDQDIVQPPFELCQEVFAGDTLLPDGFFEIRPELIFEDAVDTLHLLLFPALQPVAAEFRLFIAAVLSPLIIFLCIFT